VALSGRSLAIFLLVAAALLVSGCCGCFNPAGSSNTGAERTGVPTSAPAIDDNLLGIWTCGTSPGYVVDSEGNIQNDAYSDELYHFYDNGSYTYMIVGSGTIINGLVKDNGKYRVSGNKLYLYDSVESFTPSEGETRPAYTDEPAKDQTLAYSFEDDGKTLNLKNEDTGFTDSLHYNEPS
jgi:hypothetical protein